MITTHATERFFRCKILRCHFCEMRVSNIWVRMSYGFVRISVLDTRKDVEFPYVWSKNCKDVQPSTFNLILYFLHLIIGLFSHASMHHFIS